MPARKGVKKSTRAKARPPGWVPYAQWKAEQEIHGHGGYYTTAKKYARRAVMLPRAIHSVYKKRYPAQPSESKRAHVSLAEPWHKGMASKGGRLIGGALGGPIGGWLGEKAGDLFSSITGFGDYKIKRNTLLMGTDPAKFSRGSRPNDTVITHREFLGDIYGSTGFAIQSFPINAGLQTTFPWMSQLAAQYEQYEITGLLFEYKSTSADAVNSTNTALGTVIMATDYNVANPIFTSKAQMENHEYTTSCTPSKSFIHGVECARAETPVSLLYVRSSAVPSGSDARLYDMGNFEIATQGMQAVAIIGELWCTFRIILRKPKLNDSLGLGVNTDHWVSTTSTASGNLYFTGLTLKAGANLGTTTTSGQLNFPASILPQYYWFSYDCTGLADTVLSASLVYALGTNTVAVICFVNDTRTYIQTQAGSTSKQQSLRMLLYCPGSATNVQNFIGFTAGTLPTGATNTDVWVVQADPATLTKMGIVDGKQQEHKGTKHRVVRPSKVVKVQETEEEEEEEQTEEQEEEDAEEEEKRYREYCISKRKPVKSDPPPSETKDEQKSYEPESRKPSVSLDPEYEMVLKRRGPEPESPLPTPQKRSMKGS